MLNHSGFEEHDLYFFFGDGPVFDSTRHDEEVALFQPFDAIPKFHAKAAAHHEEQFVFGCVMSARQIRL